MVPRMIPRRSFDPTVMGIALLALLVLVEGIQLVIILGLISTFIPFGIDPFDADMFPVYKGGLQPNRQMLIYRIFIITGILAQAVGAYAFRRQLGETEFQGQIKRLLCVDAVWVFIQCYAIFKILIYQSPAWAWDLFYISLAASILSRIFWVEIVHLVGKAEGWLLVIFDPAQQKRQQTEEQGDDFLWMPLLVILGAVQLVIGFNWLLGQKMAVMPVYTYGVFILSIAGFSALVMVNKIRASKLKGFILTETVITFLLLCTLFKMVIYDYRNELAVHAYHVLLVLAVLNKVFWPGVWNAMSRVFAFLATKGNTRLLRISGDCFIMGLIILMLYLPDPQGVLAKMFVGEQFHHMSGFIMAPSWAYASGCVLDVDVISRYGVGLPIVLTTLTKLFGGLTYLSMLLVIMWVCIIYMLLCYVFLRVWLKSFALAAAAILVAIKLQLFHTMTIPQPLTYASATPIRFMFDIFFMFAVWGHLCKQRWEYLWIAALSCACALFYMIETGLYLTTAFYAYLFMNWLTPSLRGGMFATIKEKMSVALCAVSVPLGAVFFYWLAVGNHVADHQFWYNNFEFTKFFTGGLGLGHFYGGLQYGQFWDLLMGFSFPIVYLLTILIIGTLCVLGRLAPQHVMVVVLCIYGLGLNHYYVAMATANNYYTRAMPFVFVVFYWISLGMAGLSREVRIGIGIFLVAFSTYALWTNHHFLSYPNCLNFSRDPLVDTLVAEELPGRRSYYFHTVKDYPEEMKVSVNSLGQKDEGLKDDFDPDEELKEYYFLKIRFPQDARLITSLTGPHGAVALISSFETEILMEAKRKPLFYYFRFIGSRPLGMRTLGTDEMLTLAS